MDADIFDLALLLLCWIMSVRVLMCLHCHVVLCFLIFDHKEIYLHLPCTLIYLWHFIIITWAG